VRSKHKATVLGKLRELQRSIDGGLPVPDATTTTGKWLTWWAAEALPGTVAERTAADYRWVLEHYVIPHIGRVPLAKLGPTHVMAMMRTLESQGLSPRTRQYARTVLRRALGQAERWGNVTRNAAALVEAPKKAGTKLDDALDDDDAAKVLAAARGDRLEALAVLALTLGIRKGEALRLRWEDIDLRPRGRLTVRKAKTEAGERSIALPPVALAALKAHRRAQKTERMAAAHWDDPGVVFATSIGTPLDGRNALRWWHELTERAGVGRRRFHASRHTAATIMLNNGVPLEVVSATLGHAGLAITADVYAKVRPELQRQAADVMERVLGQPRS
jgi:integrase